ncbi:20429_t:CDS:1, partial [Gigaspora margarita]
HYGWNRKELLQEFHYVDHLAEIQDPFLRFNVPNYNQVLN